jgi:L-fuculose-phosphate aldolase
MTEKEFKLKRREVAYYMRRLYKRGLTTTSGGNVSLRLKEGMLITPSALDKGSIKGKQIGLINFNGENLTPDLKPSIESSMHVEVYNKRRDVNAIVHAHPLFATSFTATSQMINCALIAEARAIIGIPVLAPYALMGTEMLARSVANIAMKDDVNVILLENHGIVCLGKDLLTAFDRLEVFEAAAKMTLITSLIGGQKPLTEERLKEIDKMMHG